MPKVVLTRSWRQGKKYAVLLPNGKVIHFGSSYHQDYTQHGDKERQEAYIKRHKAREDWSDWETAGFWSRFLTWNKPNIKEAIKDIKRRFHIEVIKK